MFFPALQIGYVDTDFIFIGHVIAGAVVRVGMDGDFSKNTKCGLAVTSEQASVLGGWIHLNCNPPVPGRFVSVTKSSKGSCSQMVIRQR